LSDLAEHLGLRTRAELEEWIAAGGLKVISKTDIKAEHKKSPRRNRPLACGTGCRVNFFVALKRSLI